MKHLSHILLIFLMSMVGSKALAYDIAVKNVDGVTIYYNYINDGKELEVVYNYEYSGSIIIPDEVTYMNRTRKVTSIGEGAFQSSNITSITFGNNVTCLGACAFRDCNALTSVTIGNSVTSIGRLAFYKCQTLDSVTIGDGVTTIEEYTFSDCNALTSVTIGNNVKSIGDGAFYCCFSLNPITIPNSVTSIGAYAFYNCTKLTSITIPTSVTSIGDYTFNSCTRLNSIKIPNSVTSIGAHAFEGCSRLTSINIPNSITSIGAYAFSGCSGIITSIEIPNSVTRIGEFAFYGCRYLSSVSIPNSVTSIGQCAFAGNEIPNVISMIENPFSIHVNTFSDNTFYNATLYVPSGTIEKYKATEGWKRFLFIEEENGGGDTPTEPNKCEKPTISYQNGKLTFHSTTEGVTYQYNITDSDIMSGTAEEVKLGVTYNITVYATKAGYEDSDIASATLCWIDIEPKMEGITNAVATVRANAVLIQSFGNVLSISGAPEGTEISVFNLAGQKVGSAKAASEIINVITSLHTGEVGIVKIGEKTIKTFVR